jgi:peptidoglycan-associated lipoprotein
MLPASYDASAINDANSILAGRIVYFDFDSSKVSDDYVELVKHHGVYLASNPSVTIRLEGHTDERGTREYNVALADRRAQAVKRLLMFQGAASDQVTIISYGEEKPATLGHDESAWSMNRRAELVYQ